MPLLLNGLLLCIPPRPARRKSVHMEAAPPSLARTSAGPSSLARSSVEAAAGSLARMSMDAGPRKSLSLARSSVPLVGSEQSFWQPPK